MKQKSWHERLTFAMFHQIWH